MHDNAGKASEDIDRETAEGMDRSIKKDQKVGLGKNLFEILNGWKERIKKLHRQVSWLKHIDLVMLRSSITLRGVGAVRLERFTLSVDTRRKTVDRSRLFQHSQTKSNIHKPAEWLAICRSVLLTVEGQESSEILDYCTVNVHGFLHTTIDGLRDASIAVKMGRLSIPCDDLEKIQENYGRFMTKYNRPAKTRGMSYHPSPRQTSIPEFGDTVKSSPVQEMEVISDSKAFAGSLIRGLREVQLAIGFVGISKCMHVARQTSQQVYFNAAVKEVGVDLMRVDPESPAHRMYFSPQDVAHQALVTAISLAAGIDSGHDHPERMIYIPMLTATVKTTLPSKVLQSPSHADSNYANTNILFANLVCTSPSVDMDPERFSLLLAILRSSQNSSQQNSLHSARRQLHGMSCRLLPKATIKIAVQEPVMRVSLPHRGGKGEYDMIISSISSIAVDIDAEHDNVNRYDYALSVDYRHSAHRLYGQTFDGIQHELLFSEMVETKIDIKAFPRLSVMIATKSQNLSLFLVQPEICEGLREIVLALRAELTSMDDGAVAEKQSFLRRSPSWLHLVTIDGSDFNVEVAGIDGSVSKYSRGVGIHVQSWSAVYKADSEDATQPVNRRKSTNRMSTPINSPVQNKGEPPSRKRYVTPTDGRQLSVRIEDLEGLIIDSIDDTKGETFLNLPVLETVFTTTTDQHGSSFHIVSRIEKLLLHYALYNHFAIGVAFMLLRKTFVPIVPEDANPNNSRPKVTRQQSLMVSPTSSPRLGTSPRQTTAEITTFEVQVGLVRVQAVLPADPPLLLQIYNLEAGQQRWTSPFVRSSLTRLSAGTPQMQSVWSRVITLKSLRLDIRSFKKKVGKQAANEQSIDITTEAIRIGVPHQMVIHSIFDSIANIIKVSKQLHHRFSSGTEEYALEKKPVEPKQVPKISIRSHYFVFELEDSPFEYKIGMIYRAGLQEQKQRLAREDAFRLKSKLLNARRGGYHTRATSVDNDKVGRNDVGPRPVNKRKSQSLGRGRSQSPDRRRRVNLRYDHHGKCTMSGVVTRSVDHAREVLNKFNSESWKRVIDRAIAQQRDAIRDARTRFWRNDESNEEQDDATTIMSIGLRPSLATMYIHDLNVTVDKPSFPMDDLANFLHDVGKGMPRDMQYGLLVPMHINVNVGECRVVLRDYTLPLVHIPAMTSSQSSRLTSVALSTDFVIAEEFRDEQSQRSVDVEVVPMSRLGPQDEQKRFAVTVYRTITPVKTYSDINIDINTNAPTRITWGTSYQPAIQDMMQVIEGFMKPPIDPSDRVGFWDKIRCSFHSRINVFWKGDGDVHLNLKGSRDPYVVTGEGAGFVMVWRNNVCWRIARHADPRKFMTVDSGDYLFAVPDYDKYARKMNHTDDLSDNGSVSTDEVKQSAAFKKVVVKLSGNVQWVVGLLFEGPGPEGQRKFDLRPHWEVVLKHPDYAKDNNGHKYDAYQGFMSQFIHMSVSGSAPHARDWDAADAKPSNNYNSVHMTPRFFTHFLKWWSLFSGLMSLPIRQGRLWSSQSKLSKKFGRHLATVKYSLRLSPVFVSHMYKHNDVQDHASSQVSVTGLKMKLDSFNLDVQQRREYFKMNGNRGQTQSSLMKINEAQADLISVDFRAVAATMKVKPNDDMDNNSDRFGSFNKHASPSKIDLSKFDIPDNDMTWIDMDDFVELDWILPQDASPETVILPLGSAPRFTYFRQTDQATARQSRASPFGDENTHFCSINRRTDPRLIQAELIQRRLENLIQQLEDNKRAAGDSELKVVRDTTQDQKLRDDHAAIKRHAATLQRKYAFLNGMLQTLHQRLKDDDASAVPGLETAEPALNRTETDWRTTHMGDDTLQLSEEPRDFNNRFVVHNAQIKWNNSLRNIILRYIHQVGQRRGFVYYMSRRAVKFLLDIMEEKKKTAPTPFSARSRQNSRVSMSNGYVTPPQDDADMVEDRIEQILQDGRAFVEADDQEQQRSYAKTGRQNGDANDKSNEDISKEYVAQNAYHFRLIAPQIQLQSEKNPSSAILIAAKGMHLRVVQIMDKDRVMDDVSGLVQRRFSAAMDSMQIFVSSTNTFSMDYPHMYSGSRYGAKPGTSWPPWVPMEAMYEFTVNPYGFSRVVQRTSASLRYDKYNNLRLKYNDHVSGDGNSDASVNRRDTFEHKMDHIIIEFPQFRAICDSSQYYAMYIIAIDLLLYNEPMEKSRSERLEKIMLASDFSDLTGAPELVETLQSRIRQIDEIKTHFQLHETVLDQQGWKDRASMDRDLTNCADELFFMMKAITTSQQKMEDRGIQDDSTGILHWYVTAKELAWHLVRESDQKFLEFQIKDSFFERTDNSDGSNQNNVEFGRINGFNYLPDAIYRELIEPYVDPKEQSKDLGHGKMLRVQWLMLEAIAGIPVVDYFEVDLIPVRVQLEREVAKRLFEYIFPEVGDSAFESSGFSPFMLKKKLPTSSNNKSNDNDKGYDDSTSRFDASSVRSSFLAADAAEKEKYQGIGTGAGTLEQRLYPTYNLNNVKEKSKVNFKGSLTKAGDGQGSSSSKNWGLFSKSRSSPALRPKYTATDRARSSLSVVQTSRNSSTQSVDDASSQTASSSTSNKGKFPSPSKSTSSQLTRRSSFRNKSSNEPSDDLTQMLSRASSYMTVSYFHIHSLILCLSYKGQGKRNIEDVHDLVIRLPTIEYRNKTWSNLDLALELKKEVLRALVSHAGRIVGNKFRSSSSSIKKKEARRSIFSTSSANRSSSDVGTNVNGVESLFTERIGEDDVAWDGHSNGKIPDLGYHGLETPNIQSVYGTPLVKTQSFTFNQGRSRGISSSSRNSTGVAMKDDEDLPSISLNGTPVKYPSNHVTTTDTIPEDNNNGYEEDKDGSPSHRVSILSNTFSSPLF